MNSTIFLNLFQVAVLMIVLIGTIRSLVGEVQPMSLVFFAFAMACLLLSDLYWLVYTLLRPETRMPFAANEICEWAAFLLMGAVLRTKPLLRSAEKEMICAALFVAASTVLWIAWSGEWVQDILTGVVFGWFLCCLVACAKQEDAFPRWEWILLGVGCIVLIAAQTAIFFLPEERKRPVDLFCYALMFAGDVYLLVRALLALRRGGAPGEFVCRSFAAFGWTITTMYMSSGGFYLAAIFLCTLCFPLMLPALRKEAAP